MFKRSYKHIFKRYNGLRISGYGPEGLQGEQRPQSGSLCRRVQGEGHSLLRGAGG